MTLRLECINKSFDRKQVLKDINLEIEEGTFCVFLGPSGCGKSTLLNIIAGLEPATSGRVYFKQKDITFIPPHQRDMAMVFQNYALYPHLTVYENVAFGLRARALKQEIIEGKVQEVSRILNIQDKLGNYPRQLSGGERQRVATARAIVRDPNLFLFDEPLSNLDALLRLEVRKEFLELRRRLKKTALYVTHDQHEALSLGDLIVVLRDGKIQQLAAPQELYDHPQNLFVAGFIGTPPMNIIQLDVEHHRDRLVLTKKGFSLPLPPELAERLSRRHGRSIFLGVRPSAVVLEDAQTGSPYSFDGEIQLKELLGEDVLAYVRIVPEFEIKAVFRREKLGDRKRVRVGLRPETMYFFDEEGKNI